MQREGESNAQHFFADETTTQIPVSPSNVLTNALMRPTGSNATVTAHDCIWHYNTYVHM